MRPNSYYDDDLNDPKPPSNWRVAAAILAFVVVFIAFAMFCTSCACHYDGNGVNCAIDGEEALRAIIVLSEK